MKNTLPAGKTEQTHSLFWWSAHHLSQKPHASVAIQQNYKKID